LQGGGHNRPWEHHQALTGKSFVLLTPFHIGILVFGHNHYQRRQMIATFSFGKTRLGIADRGTKKGRHPE
jgi:hypothetical protein